MNHRNFLYHIDIKHFTINGKISIQAKLTINYPTFVDKKIMQSVLAPFKTTGAHNRFSDIKDSYISNLIRYPLRVNPLTILDDLRECCDPIIYKEKRLGYKDLHYTTYKYEYAFGVPILINNDKDYIQLVKKIKKYMENDSVYSEKRFYQLFSDEGELLSYKYDIDFSIYKIEEKKLPTIISNRLRSKTKNLFYEPSYLKVGKSILKTENVFDDDHLVSYQCHSMCEVLISFLHFFAIHGYHFSKCKHCQKYYIKLPTRGQGKRDYCYRDSPINISYFKTKYPSKRYDKMINQDCPTVVSVIRQIITDIHNTNISRNWSVFGNTGHDDYLKYCKLYDDQWKITNANPNIKNLTDLFNYVLENREKKKSK